MKPKKEIPEPREGEVRGPEKQMFRDAEDEKARLVTTKNPEAPKEK